MGKKLDRLSRTLERMLKARGMQAQLSEYRILGIWPKAVGPSIARHARPIMLHGKKLFLAVDSPAWMQQLSLLKPEIIEKVNKNLGENAIKEITFKLGEIPNHEAPSQTAWVRPVMTQEEHAKIDGYIGGLQDPDIRTALRRLIEKDLLSKKSREKK